MKTSIATVSIAGSLSEKITAIARAGFDGFELFENDFVASSMSLVDFKSKVADNGLTVDLYQPFRDFEGVSKGQLKLNLERAKLKFELMRELGVETILVCSNVSTATEPNDNCFVSQLGELAELASTFEVKVAYEALAWGKFVSTYDHSWRIVQQADHKNLGLCLDSFHILSRGTDLGVIEQIPGNKIFYMQLADAPALDMDVLSWSRHHRLFPGEGGWDIADFVHRVLKTGYIGPLSLEIFNDVYRQGSPTITARDGHRSLTYLADQVQSLRNQESLTDLGLGKLAPVQSASDFEFVELTPGEGAEMESLLSGLGFIKTGKHSRKAATLWQSGTAKVVVNAAQVSPSAELSTVGLRYSNRNGMMTRLKQLQYEISPRDREGIETDFGVVESPGGTSFHISDANDSNWVSEFGTNNSASDSGIVAIDHVAIRESWQTADESTLFLRAALGLSIQSELDLPSEHGLVRSRSANNVSKTVRLAMNVNPVHENANAANHIAFSTTDIFKTAEFAKRQKLNVMSVPGNYYEDLQHRTGLDAALIEKLKQNDVLYDRDATGEFLHFYTVQLGTVFFEVIQRTAGYDGYGAYNSFVRLASLRSSNQQKARHDR